MAEQNVNVIFGDVTIDLKDKSFDPNYMTTVSGGKVRVDSRDILGCLADHIFLAKIINNKGARFQTDVVKGFGNIAAAKGLNASEKAAYIRDQKGKVLYSLPYISQQQGVAQLARYYMTLADACDKYRVSPMDVMGPVAQSAGAKRGYLCRVQYYDAKNNRPGPEVLMDTPDKLREEAKSLGDTFEYVSQSTPNIAVMKGTGDYAIFDNRARYVKGSLEDYRGMGLFPLLIWVIIGIVAIVISLGAWSINKTADWFTKHDEMLNKRVVDRFSCYDKYAAAYAEETDPEKRERLKENMETCEKQAENAANDQAGSSDTFAKISQLFYVAIAGVAIYGGYKIFSHLKDNGTFDKVLPSKFTRASNGLYLPR